MLHLFKRQEKSFRLLKKYAKMNWFTKHFWLDVAQGRMIPEAGIETRLTQTPIQDSTTQPRGSQRQRSKFKRLWITIVIVYIYLLNGYRELDSYEEPCIYANGNTITSFARELNPTGVGEYIYIYCHPQTDLFRSIWTHQCGYIYIHIHVCVCVCMCLCVCVRVFWNNYNSNQK